MVGDTADSKRTHGFDKAALLLRRLVGEGAPWTDRAPGAWLFRGQADYRWALVPSSLRAEAVLPDADGRWVTGPRPTELVQALDELRGVREFAVAADQMGLPLPDDSQILRAEVNRLSQPTDALRECLESEPSGWPPRALLSLLAIAQHEGVATRLLDWSHAPLVAAYFAAVGAARRLSDGDMVPDDKLAIWALDPTVFADGMQASKNAATGQPEPTIERVSAPTASNPNLRAQRGVFAVLRRPAVRAADPPRIITLERLLWDSPRADLLHRLTLPASEAGALLKLLAALGVHAGSIFPGFAGVRTSIAERSFWT